VRTLYVKMLASLRQEAGSRVMNNVANAAEQPSWNVQNKRLPCLVSFTFRNYSRFMILWKKTM